MEEVTKKEPGMEIKKITAIRGAVAMFLAGYDLETIANRYQYSSAARAQEAIDRELAKSYTSADLSAARNKSLAQKMTLLRSLWPDATNPFLREEDGTITKQRNEAHLPYNKQALMVIESIDRLLGTNAATQVEFYRPDADEFLTTMASLRAIVLENEGVEGDIFDAEILEIEGS